MPPSRPTASPAWSSPGAPRRGCRRRCRIPPPPLPLSLPQRPMEAKSLAVQPGSEAPRPGRAVEGPLRRQEAAWRPGATSHQSPSPTFVRFRFFLKNQSSRRFSPPRPSEERKKKLTLTPSSSPPPPPPPPHRHQNKKTQTNPSASNPYITSGSLPPFGAHGRDFDLFWEALEHHWGVELPAAGAPPPVDYGTRKFGVPTVCSDRLNLASLYREVCLRGGHAAVGEAKWWKRVGSALAGVEAATRSTALGTVLKYAYEKW